MASYAGAERWEKSVGKTVAAINRSYLWRTAVMVAACAVFYYLPDILSVLNIVSAHEALNQLHDFYGIDFYSLAFFIPVVYAAYKLGVFGSLTVAMAAMMLLYPYILTKDLGSFGLLRPTAFAIILSAVGAVVAMLQKSDEQRRRNVSELKCLYEIGRAAQKTDDTDEFVQGIVETAANHLGGKGETRVRIYLRDKCFESRNFKEASVKFSGDINGGGKQLGTMEVFTDNIDTFLRQHPQLIASISERVGSAINEMELQKAHKEHYKEMKEMVKKKTLELEKAQEKIIRSERLSAVGELASGIGHELRNPLNVIRNCVYLLDSTVDVKDNEDIALTLKTIDRQVDITNRIVTDLLDFTRVNPPSMRTVQVNDILKESLTWVSVPAEVNVVCDFAKGLPSVQVDADQIGRAFANILTNGIQAMSSVGELKVSSAMNGNNIVVSISDQGVGIPEENLVKIFDPLFTTKPKGIGLGLAITKRFIEQNGGHIDVKSKTNEGTAFIIKIPVAKEEVQTK